MLINTYASRSKTTIYTQFGIELHLFQCTKNMATGIIQIQAGVIQGQNQVPHKRSLYLCLQVKMIQYHEW